MTVLLDPPLWPRHGRVWGHLVSDTSLEELHALAERAGIPRRAFDRDHYDVPADRYGELVACGAVLVDGRELVRRLRRSGLRVTARERRQLGSDDGPDDDGGRLPEGRRPPSRSAQPVRPDR